MMLGSYGGGAEAGAESQEGGCRDEFGEGFKGLLDRLRLLQGGPEAGATAALELCEQFERQLKPRQLDSRLAAEEYHTWRLLVAHLRFRQRVEDPVLNPDDGSDYGKLQQHRHDDSVFDWMGCVLAWAEGTAVPPQWKDAVQTASPQWDGTWAATGQGGSTDYISHLDPDACSRDRKTPRDGLIPRDNDQQNKFLQFLWGYLRAGELETCQRLCRESSQPGGGSAQSWRAATLQGCVVSRRGGHGNGNRKPWRRACKQLASDKTVSTFERAIYGVLTADTNHGLELFGGNETPGVLRTWHDKFYVWAKLTVDQRADELLAVASQSTGGDMMDAEDADEAFSEAELRKSWQRFTADSAGVALDSPGWDTGGGGGRPALEAAIKFFRDTQELLIFGTASCRGDREGQVAAETVGLGSARLLVPDVLWEPIEPFEPGIRTCKSKVLRCALHMGLLLEGGQDALPLANHYERYIELLAGLARLDEEDGGGMEGVASCLQLIALYSQGLPGKKKEEVLTKVMSAMPTTHRQIVVDGLGALAASAGGGSSTPRREQAVIEQVQRQVVSQIVQSDRDDDASVQEKLDVFRWAVSPQNASSPLDRLNGLRHLNAFLRAALLCGIYEEHDEKQEHDENDEEEDYLVDGAMLRGLGRTWPDGMDGMDGAATEAVGDGLVDEQLRLDVEGLVESFPTTVGGANGQWQCWEKAGNPLPGRSVPPPVDGDPRGFCFADCNNDIKEWRCWELFDESQTEVAKLHAKTAELAEYTDGLPPPELLRGTEEQYNLVVVALSKVIHLDGWMRDDGRPVAGGGRAADGQPRRLAELKAIRQAALPRVCFQLLFQLQEKGDYNSCLNLIELIADESTSVYRDFPPEEMKRLLTEVPKILIRVAQTPPEHVESENRLRRDGLEQLFADI